MFNLTLGKLSTRSILVVSLWAAAAGLATNALRLNIYAQQPVVATPSISGGELVAARTPYTVVVQDTTRSPSGEVTQNGTQTSALRSDGSYVDRFEFIGGPRNLIQRFIYLPSGVTIVVDDIREVRTTRLERAGTTARARMDPTRNCVKNSLGETLGVGEFDKHAEAVHGHATLRVQSGRSTVWLARQLGCAQLKTITLLPDGVVSEKVPIQVIEGEPDAAIFYVPDRYTEVQSSTFYGIDPNSPEGMKVDRDYFARRPPQ